MILEILCWHSSRRLIHNYVDIAVMRQKDTVYCKARELTPVTLSTYVYVTWYPLDYVISDTVFMAFIILCLRTNVLLV
jgi:hypothetical protein